MTMERQLLDKAWAAYQVGIENEDYVSLRELGLPVGPRNRMGFAPALGDEGAAKSIVERLIALWESGQRKDAESMDDERKIVELGIEFLRAVEFGMLSRAHEILDAGFPVNFLHPRKKETALHISASKIELNEFSGYLLDRGDCDLLLRDEFGRLAWNNVVFFNPSSEELIEKLSRETKVMADAEGVDLLEEQKRFQLEWFTQNWFLRLSQRADYFPE